VLSCEEDGELACAPAERDGYRASRQQRTARPAPGERGNLRRRVVTPLT
jgi:hypothetical protein